MNAFPYATARGRAEAEKDQQRVPLFIVCRRCQQLKEVPTKRDQQTHQFCSNRCAALGRDPAARLKGQATNRAKAAARFDNLTPAEIRLLVRNAYLKGWRRGVQRGQEQAG